MSKHLCFDERVAIQEGLDLGKSISWIAQAIGRSKSTVSREVQARCSIIEARGNVCLHRKECDLPKGCKTKNCETPYNCSSGCALCRRGCPDFEEEYCPHRENLRDFCNSCKKQHCRFGRRIYSARDAQKQYEQSLSDSRKGISLTEAELEHLDRVVSRKILQGISVPVICMELADVLPVSERTIYTYIDMGLLGVSNLELRRTVQRKLRKKTGPVLRVDKKCHVGRTYEDYQTYLENNPDICSSNGQCHWQAGRESASDDLLHELRSADRIPSQEEHLPECFRHIQSIEMETWRCAIYGTVPGASGRSRK